MTESLPATPGIAKRAGLSFRSRASARFSDAGLLASGKAAAGARAYRRSIVGTILAAVAMVGSPALSGAEVLAGEDASARIASDGVPGPTDLSSAADTLRIRLALAGRLHVPWARAEIIRPTDESRRDVIVLTSESTLADLEKAVRLLASSHSTQPKPLEWEIRGHVSATAQQPAPGPMLDALERSLRDLADGETASISEHGDLPSVEVDLAVEIDSSEPQS